MPRFLPHAFFLLLGTLVVLMAAARFLLPSLAFHPTREIIATPADAGLRYEDVTLTADDGVRLRAWYVPAENAVLRSEERRVGKECRSRWSPYH